MSTNAGDIRELAIDHDELGSRILEGKSGEDVNTMKGGFKSNDDDGNIGVNGTRINQLNRYPWSLECTIIAKEGDLDYLQALSQSTIEANITATFMDQTIRVGTGQTVGDIQENKQAGTIAIKLAGSGTFEEI